MGLQFENCVKLHAIFVFAQIAPISYGKSTPFFNQKVYCKATPDTKIISTTDCIPFSYPFWSIFSAY